MRAQHLHHFVADNLDYLLRRGERGEHLRAQRLLFDRLDKLLGDPEMHVGLEQRHADLAQRGLHVFRREFPLAAQVFENPLQLVA